MPAKEKEEKPSKESLKAWHDDPSSWKLGIFYFNKKDRRLFPPKRFYMGWTINFANPYSVILLITLILVIVGLANFFTCKIH